MNSSLILIYFVAASAIIFFLNPEPAFANAGTPLIWSSLIHLFFGNAIIGVIETKIVSKLFNISFSKSVIFIIIANYFSFFVGYLIISNLTKISLLESWSYPGVTIHNYFLTIIKIILLSIMSSIAFEWPFFYYIFRGESTCLSKSVKAAVIAQILSYLLIIIYYSMLSDASLITELHKNKGLGFSQNSSCHVYYISESDGGVYRIRANGLDNEIVSGVNISGEMARLFLTYGKTDGKCDLWAINKQDAKPQIALDEIDCKNGYIEPESEHLMDTWMKFGNVDFIESGKYRVRTGFWANQGLYVTSNDDTYTIALDTPIMPWMIRNAIGLRDNQLVFQANNQIYLLDVEKKDISVLANGKGPAVICE